MTLADQIDSYYAKMGEAWALLPESERAGFQAWKDANPTARNSDWPGWNRYIGFPRPRRSAELIILQGKAAG